MRALGITWKIFALSLLLASIGANAIPGNQSDNLNLSFYGEPRYTVLVHTSDPHINSGDKFKIELFISGAGDVDLSRISVDIPRFVVKGGKVKLTILNYRMIDPNNKTIQGTIEELDQEPGFYLLLPDIWYMLVADKGNYLSPKPQIFGESPYQVNGTYYAPYTIDFIAKDNASAGDYDIPINYVYKYSDKWYQDTKIIKLHLNHWYETDFWQSILQFGAILGIILTVVLLLKEICSYLVKKCSR